MALNNNLGRPKTIDKYTDPRAYLNEVVFPIDDALIAAKKELNKAKGIVTVINQKKQRAYDGLSKFRR